MMSSWNRGPDEEWKWQDYAYWIGVPIVLCMLSTCNPAHADYYVVTGTPNGKNIKHFEELSDCRQEFERTSDIITLSGGEGWVVCVPASMVGDL